MKDKFVFRYDKDTKKGLIKTDKGELKIDLEKKPPSHIASLSSGSGGGGYGLHLI